MTVASGRTPHGAYTTIVSVFGGGLALAGALAHALHRDPREHDALDLVVLGAATFKAARTIARDEVTSFLRDPFVEGRRTRAALNDFAQAGFAALTAKANRLED